MILAPKTRLALLATALLASGPSVAQSLAILAPGCREPESVDVPAAGTATEAELEKAGPRVKSFVANGEEYLKCLQMAEASLGDTITPEQRAALLGAYNSTVDRMQATGTMYNQAVRAWKERNP